MYQSFTNYLILLDRRFMMFKKFINPMSHSVKIYDTCIGCTQCIRALPHGSKQTAFTPRTDDCVGCKRCESAGPTDFLSVSVYFIFIEGGIFSAT
ncbi:hypothetical protein AMTRI_Chr07g77660 [Amborella trichopoda]